MKKIKGLILLATVIMGYHGAQGYKMTVKNKLPYNKGLTIKVGVSGGLCGENVQGPIYPVGGIRGRSVHRFTNGCRDYCFNQLDVKGDTDNQFFPVKEKDDNGGYKDLTWEDGCGRAWVSVVGEKRGFYVVEYTKSLSDPDLGPSF